MACFCGNVCFHFRVLRILYRLLHHDPSSHSVSVGCPTTASNAPQRMGAFLMMVAQVGLLAGCGTTPSSPVTHPAGLDPTQLMEPTPHAEPPSRRGNPGSYTINGKDYTVMRSSEGYREQGVASWYGPGFHGKKTSNGDVYDMYVATAAHKNLPIPTYVKVTHQETGRSVVVRVNDRGPFVDGRIIDLSYAAATKLGMVQRGTAPVEVVALPPYQYLPDAPSFHRHIADPQARTRSRIAEAAPPPPKPSPRTLPRATPRLASSTPTGFVPVATVPSPAKRPDTQPVVPQADAPYRRSPPVEAPPRAENRLVAATAPPTATPTVSQPAVSKSIASKPIASKSIASEKTISSKTYLYAGQFALPHNAEVLKQRLNRSIPYPVQIEQAGRYYRLRIGPVAPHHVEQVTVQLARMGITAARWVTH